MPAKTTGRTAKKSTGKTTGGKKATGRTSGKRTLINTGRDKRYIRRDASGRIKESDDQGKSLSTDRRRKAKTVSKPGQGDRGDRKR